MTAKPRLGQNFLHDVGAIQRIVAALGDVAGRTVVEIGPGKGAITRVLARRAGRVIAVELDRELAEGLRRELPPERATVVNADVLDFNLEAACVEAGEALVVVGNLPYYVTSPILLKLATSHTSLSHAVLMVQREVADRVAAGPGTRDYGLLSVTAQLHGPVEKLFTLPPGAFSPPPKVHSTVIRWRFAPRFAELGVDEAEFAGFLRRAFAHKRKTLANNLRAAGILPGAVTSAMMQAGIDARSRAEAVNVESLAALWRSLQSKGAAPHDEAAPIS
ncbi:MAG TPA: 16S rRNA (adenine(1518)-N(6)/adenine(1519)-N(6))-dimethyltransferase RsmA [Terracidiphilus sp.]|nr:16S rRNA (adenine(1518)-N(6)/adenine(1519)-N(6))-dimethyltransferase RsmA [Terracidiphilus sp.]